MQQFTVVGVELSQSELQLFAAGPHSSSRRRLLQRFGKIALGVVIGVTTRVPAACTSVAAFGLSRLKSVHQALCHFFAVAVLVRTGHRKATSSLARVLPCAEKFTSSVCPAEPPKWTRSSGS